MVPEIGNIALTLALVLSILLAVYPLWGAHRQHDTLMATAKPLLEKFLINSAAPGISCTW